MSRIDGMAGFCVELVNTLGRTSMGSYTFPDRSDFGMAARICPTTGVGLLSVSFCVSGCRAFVVFYNNSWCCRH